MLPEKKIRCILKKLESIRSRSREEYKIIQYLYLLGLDPTIGYHTEDLVVELRLVGGYRLSTMNGHVLLFF